MSRNVPWGLGAGLAPLLWASTAMAQEAGGLRFGVGAVFLGMFGVIFFPMAAWYILPARRHLQRAATSLGWPRAQGRIVASEVQDSTNLGRLLTKSSAELNMMSEDQLKSFEPRIRYVYSVAGTEYESQQIQFGLTTVTKKEAHALMERYPVGREVPVVYDPSAPDAAVLETVATSARQRLVTGLVLAAVPFLAGAGVVLALRYTG